MDLMTTTQQTLWSDLGQRTFEAQPVAAYPENGSFVRRQKGDRTYWYYVGYRTRAGGETEAKQTSVYAGPGDDPDTERTIAAFQRAKAGYKERQDLVRSLKALGFPTPVPMAGDIAEAFARVGLFDGRTVLIGATAFATYPGTLGVRMRDPLAGSDVDDPRRLRLTFSGYADDLLEALQGFDGTFARNGYRSDETRTSIVNRSGFEVMVYAGGASDARKPASPPIGFLIREPERSVLIHKGGVAVTVPSAERFCIHALLSNGPQARRAATIMEAVVLQDRMAAIGTAWMEAWIEHPSWRPRLLDADRRLEPPVLVALKRAREATYRNLDPGEKARAQAAPARRPTRQAGRDRELTNN